MKKTIFVSLLLLTIFLAACNQPTKKITITDTSSQQEQKPQVIEVGLQNYPDEPLDGTPSEPISIKFMVEHRSALNGKSITLQGFVVKSILGDNTCPPDNGMCVESRVFLGESLDESRNKDYDIMVVVSDTANYNVGDNVQIKGTVYGGKNSVILDAAVSDTVPSEFYPV